MVIEKRYTSRNDLSHHRVGIIHSDSFFIKRPQVMNSHLVDISAEGFRVICNKFMLKMGTFDFILDLPLYGIIVGRCEMVWLKGIESDEKLSEAGFNFLKFKKDGKKKIDEMTSSDKIVHVLNEMGTEVLENIDEKKAG
jgi:hypothetical protein